MAQRPSHTVPELLRSAVKTLRVDLEKDIDRMSDPRRHVSGRDSGVQPRRQGGVPQVVGDGSHGDAHTSGVKTIARARLHALMIVSLGNSLALRSPRNSRPSGAVPNCLR